MVRWMLSRSLSDLCLSPRPLITEIGLNWAKPLLPGQQNGVRVAYLFRKLCKAAELWRASSMLLSVITREAAIASPTESFLGLSWSSLHSPFQNAGEARQSVSVMQSVTKW